MGILASLAGFADLTSGVFVCYVKTGRLLETKTGNFQLGQEPQNSSNRPSFVRIYLNLPGSRRICSKDALLPVESTAKNIFAHSADRISQPSFSTRRSESPDLKP